MIKEEKRQLRKYIKEEKAKISHAEKQNRSEVIWRKMEVDDTFRKAKTIMLYWSMADEVHTHDFIEKWHDAKRIILPAVNGDKLDLKVYEGYHSMVRGAHFGIMEPAGSDFTALGSIDLIVVPGVAFDHQNNRMGRGKAYYDKLLQKVSCAKYGVCFDFQLLENVPADEHDIPMDRVITDG